MANSVLRKLSRPTTPLDVAGALLAKHIGQGTNEMHCTDALEVISSARNVRIQQVAKATGLLLGPSAAPCELATEIAVILQSFAQTQP